jgi:hypothetical protein
LGSLLTVAVQSRSGKHFCIVDAAVDQEINGSFQVPISKWENGAFGASSNKQLNPKARTSGVFRSNSQKYEIYIMMERSSTGQKQGSMEGTNILTQVPALTMSSGSSSCALLP